MKITTLKSGKYRLAMPIPISVKKVDGEYIAIFLKMEIARSGDTEEDAIAWLQSSIVTLYEYLKGLPAEQLGPLPTRQLGVLEEYLVENTGAA